MGVVYTAKKARNIFETPIGRYYSREKEILKTAANTLEDIERKKYSWLCVMIVVAPGIIEDKFGELRGAEINE